jgi:hypothetical protein
MSAKGTAATTRLRKVECDLCGCIARMSRAAIRKSGLPTCGCGQKMTCADLEDAATCLPERELLIQPVYVEARELETRRAMRDNKRVAGAKHQCHSCKAFIAHPKALCGCGFLNDPRPGAGGYVETTYTGGFGKSASSMPF